MVFALQVSVALIFFANKVFLLIGKKSGWLLGAIAAILAILYFFILHLYIFTVLEVGLVILMAYAYWKTNKQSKKAEIGIRVVILAVLFVLTGLVFTGFMTIVELLGSVAMLCGTYFLIPGSRLKRLGWALYATAHIFSSYVGYGKGQDFFADFQVASAIVCFAGAIHKPKRND